MQSLTKSQKKILDKLELYKETIENSPIGIGILNLTGEFLYLNQRVCQLIGYTREELLMTKLGEKVHPEELKETLQSYQQLIRGEKLWVEVHKRLLHKNGNIVHAKTTVTLLKDSKGKPTVAIAMIEDFTEVKESNISLRKSKERLLQAVDTSDAVITVLDLAGNVLYVNHVYPGIEKEEYIGSSIYDWMSEDLAAELKIKLKLVQDNPVPMRFEVTNTNRRGSTRYYFHNMSPLFEDDVLKGVTVISQEITKHRRLEAQLNRNTEIMKLGLEATDMGVWEHDFKSGVLTIDSNAHRILGWEPGTFPGRLKDVMEMVIEEEKEDFAMNLEFAIKNLEESIGHYRFKRKNDGVIRHISYRVKIFRDKEGTLDKALGVSWDSTKEKQREERKKKSIELEQQNKELRQFTYIASHDLQGPLKTVMNFTKLLKRDYQDKLDEKADIYLNFISDAVERMQSLIKDLLELSLTRQEANLEMIDCKELIQHIEQDLIVSIKESECILEYRDLPLIKGYKTELFSLFQNLIGNAIKFRSKDRKLLINISHRKCENHWEFAIRDNGIGIEEQHHDRVFEIFQRLHTHQEYKGTGIGLAHCKKIVELHLGKIWVESELDKGSTFYFTLPY